MISAGEFRKGITFEMNGEPHVILDFQHVKPGKGSPFVRTKYKNILTGATREEAFNPNDKFPKAHIETKKMQYLYNDGLQLQRRRPVLLHGQRYLRPDSSAP